MSSKYTLFSILTLLLLSCQPEKESPDQNVSLSMKTADSLSVSGKYAEAAKYLSRIRPTLNPNRIDICQYHLISAEINRNNVAKMSLHADSALKFFERIYKRKIFPYEYRQALLLQGEAFFLNKNYIKALNFFNAAKNTVDPDHCDDGNLSSKIANIHYIQKNYQLAAKYWSESYTLLSHCTKAMSDEKYFYRKQGVLNNIGLAYHRATILDSAQLYYQKNLDFIQEEKNQQRAITPAARIVAYDNFGGLQLDLGNLKAAEDYLTKSIAIQVAEADGIKIPPLIKLLRLYMKTGDTGKAAAAFKESRRLLKKFSVANIESEIEWNRLYADFLLQRGDAKTAYQYLNTHILKKDSLELSSARLYKLNVEGEFELINQQQQMISLIHEHKVRLLYFGSVGIVLILGFLVVYLILKRSRKDHRETLRENEDLARLNANYIRMMRVMAHDLRNPLSGITGLTELMMLDKDVFSEEHQHMLKLVQTTGKHATEMISELLKTGLSDENEPIQKEALDVQSAVKDCVELLRFRAAEKQQQIILKGNQSPKIAAVNHQKFLRALNNIIVNAIKFSHTGSSIEIEVKQQEDCIQITVEDQGVGIPDADREHVFQMFSPAKKEGTNGEKPFGLGLSITKKIIEKHGGAIWFESVPETGTTFYIQLPV